MKFTASGTEVPYWGLSGNSGIVPFMLFMLCFISGYAQKDYIPLRTGDALYKNKDYAEAETM